MSVGSVREPKQKRSIETKHKIIDASFQLFSEVGYFGTNTAEIAKRAGVSTGIVYGYFKDKRDILLEILELYTTNVYSSIFDIFDGETELNLETLVPKIIDGAISAHKNNAKIHEALHSMTHVDETVNLKFMEQEDEITLQFAKKLTDLNCKSENLREKIHLAMNMVQSFSHECIYDKHAYIDYEKMREIVTRTIINLFKD